MIIDSLRADYVERGQYFGPDELYDSGAHEPSERLILGAIVRLADEVRRRWGKPLVCSAGVRTPAKQTALKTQGYRAASTSPHVFRCAMDLDVSTATEVRKLVEIVRKAAADLEIPVRIGWRDYLNAGQTFVHIDCAPLIADILYGQGLISRSVYTAWRKAGVEW